MLIFNLDQEQLDFADNCTTITFNYPATRAGQSIMITPAQTDGNAKALLPGTLHKSLFIPSGSKNPLATGTVLCLGNKPVLGILGHFMIPAFGTGHTTPCLSAISLCDIEDSMKDNDGFLTLKSYKKSPALAWITLSDKGFIGERQDESGPSIEKMLQEKITLRAAGGYILPDDPDKLRALVTDLAYVQGYDLIICTGGTGLGKRDKTPEALLALFDKRLPGFEQAMMLASMSKTPNAIISRAVAGCMGESIVIALPGSTKAATENLAAIIPALEHALAKLQGDTSDCGIRQ